MRCEETDDASTGQMRTRRLIAFIAAVAALRRWSPAHGRRRRRRGDARRDRSTSARRRARSTSSAVASVPIWGFVSKPTGVPCSDPGVEAAQSRARCSRPPTASGRRQRHQRARGAGRGRLPRHRPRPGARPRRAPGATVTYTFTAAPGTYVYQSGADAGRQAAMGLYGALVVHPTAPGQAYDDPSTAFDSERSRC